jgi:hypothetical protein
VPSRLGTALPRKSIAWFWFAATAIPAAFFAWRALSDGSWAVPLVLGVLAALIAIEPRLRKRDVETVEIDESGVTRVDGAVREHILWADVREIRILTTDEGPFREDVFFALITADGKGCLIPHDAAERVRLVEALESRFPNVDDDMIIKAMGTTSNASFLIWKARAGGD